MGESVNPDSSGDEARSERARQAALSTGALQDLRPFADQLMAIAQQLRDGDLEPKPATSAPDAGGYQARSQDKPAPHDDYLAIARRTYAVRRQRAAIFGSSELFGEPAWDILLDLFIAQAEGKTVSVSSACIGSAAPPTTGLRWLGVLADQGLVLREQDADDQRRVLVRLTERGIAAMEQYFASAGGPY
ncbi:MarR family transcriptional regulator [Erythrobacter sp. JK5]|uniref:MarR family transcriptional regulator n=1 Tax=Erythrobacter sp. JK5 TaxID=2829500 RepID=UPI00353028CF